MVQVIWLPRAEFKLDEYCAYAAKTQSESQTNSSWPEFAIEYSDVFYPHENDDETT